jgi:hypothetical protein
LESQDSDRWAAGAAKVMEDEPCVNISISSTPLHSSGVDRKQKGKIQIVFSKML